MATIYFNNHEYETPQLGTGRLPGLCDESKSGNSDHRMITRMITVIVIIVPFASRTRTGRMPGLRDESVARTVC
jgi:hypothetical protein